MTNFPLIWNIQLTHVKTNVFSNCICNIKKWVLSSLFWNKHVNKNGHCQYIDLRVNFGLFELTKKVNKQRKENKNQILLCPTQQNMRYKDNSLWYTEVRSRSQPVSQSAHGKLSLGSLGQSGLQNSTDQTKPLAPA